MMEKIGRLPSDEQGKRVVEDNPSKMSQAILTKQDEILEKLNFIIASIDTATDAATLYTELSAIGADALKEIEVNR